MEGVVGTAVSDGDFEESDYFGNMLDVGSCTDLQGDADALEILASEAREV